MGRGSGRVRVLAAVVFTAVAWLSTAGGAAQADTADGLSVPDVVFSQGSGDQTVDITIGSGFPDVGFGASIDVYASSPYIVAVSGSSVGATCSGSGTWTCSADDLRTGVIRVTVSTASTDCNSEGVCATPLMAKVEGPGGWLVMGSVKIKPKQPVAPPKTSAPAEAVPIRTSARPTAAPRTSERTVAAKASRNTPPAEPSPSAASASATSASAAASAPSAPALAPAADARPRPAGNRIAEIAVPCAVVLLAAGFVLGRIVVLRRRRAASAAESASEPPTRDGGAGE